MIEAKGLQRSYEDGEGNTLQVLAGVDLWVAPGEFLAITGRSGSGKSTLLHILGGLDADYRGEVTVAGSRITGMSDDALARFRNLQVAFVFQSFHLVAGLRALDNVALPAFFGGAIEDAEVDARAREALERVGLKGKADRLPAQLSGGERQRVAIARALFTRPKVLFCDEPTGNLDGATGNEVIALFSQLNAEGLTVVAVTHEDRMSAAARRVLKLQDGRLA